MGYAQYTDLDCSGVAWLQHIPCHWGVKRLKFSAELINNKVSVEESPLPYLGLEHIESWTGRKIEGEIVNSEGVASSFLAGDVLFGKLRPYLAKVHLAQRDGLISSEALVIRSKAELHAEFLKYYMLSRDFINIVNSSTFGSKMPRASWDFIGNLPVLLPEVEEQQAIASFLDFKTAQIDALIAKKQALLEKLAEKRIALISHAVTKGLNSSVPMKDSGAAWLGLIPESWKILPFRRLIIGGTQNGIYKAKEFFSEDGTAFIQMGEAFSEPIIKRTAKDRVLLSQAELSQWGLEQGDLIFARRSLVFEGSGKCAVVGELEEPHAYESSMIRVRLNKKEIMPMFAFHYFGGAFGRAQILATTKQVTISGIDSQQLKDVLVCVPPASEQDEILDYIQQSECVYIRAHNKVTAVVERLQEYRSSLITNAVTGKIDVRSFIVPQFAKV
ncbi:restriction endonuclease subunit S [Pseudomonas sp. AO-1]|uniref:restriction endonuclease subunit S n=1 Tax=Pseudomonas sp. AO-1 TaxID=2855434 RepID=UPI001C762C89|nr:restriction endonuclease subunit S [Pseudomonas sp. AO-1]QXZ16464.1 restriction endonuclease subunit S [Pseudomonas sp. AO-1]